MTTFIRGTTRILGLLGWPVSHSKSPVMQTAAARAAGLDLVYVPFPVHPDGVAEAVRGLAALGVMGVNVTVPHKQAVMPFLDTVDPAAAALGAVNTIVVKQGGGNGEPFNPHLTGYNTDAPGFLRDLSEHGVDPHGRPALILGAGGSARAVAYALAAAGAQVHVLARRLAQAEGLVSALADHLPADTLHAAPLTAAPELALSSPGALLVNTTPLGMAPHEEQSVWADDWPFPSGGFVYDLVYQPAETQLMRQAQAAGVPTANGLGMLLYQGAESFYLWTGVRPDVGVMRQALFA